MQELEARSNIELAINIFWIVKSVWRWKKFDLVGWETALEGHKIEQVSKWLRKSCRYENFC